VTDVDDAVPAAAAARRSGVDLDELARLEEERRFLLRSLADLEREHDAGDLDDADFVTLRDDYTARAAAVLRAIEAGRAALPPKRGPRRRGRTAALVGLTVVLAVAAGLLVARSSGTRLPGSEVSGSTAQTSTQLLSEARFVQATDKLAAAKLYDQVLAIDPQNVEALTYRGWVLIQLGSEVGSDTFRTRGEENLDQAIALRPDYPDARAFKGVVLFRLHDDPAGATEQFEAFLASDPPPEMRSLMESIIAEARTALEGAASADPSPATTAAG
jgi:hypothetical protein